MLLTCSVPYVLKNSNAHSRCPCRAPGGLFRPTRSDIITQTRTVVPKIARKQRFSDWVRFRDLLPIIRRAGTRNSVSLVTGGVFMAIGGHDVDRAESWFGA